MLDYPVYWGVCKGEGPQYNSLNIWSVDVDAGGMAIALLHLSAGPLKN